METYREFMNRISAFELPELSLGNGAFISSESVAKKVYNNNSFRSFYGDTIVFDLSEQEKIQIHSMTEQLYSEVPECFSERLGKDTLHMTLHDLSNSPELADASLKMQENEKKLREILSAELVVQQSIQMHSMAVFNMVNTSLVIGFYPADEQEYKKLMYLYQLADRIVKLPYLLTPHITLAYYNKDGFPEISKRKLESVVNRLNKSPVSVTLDTERLCYKHFKSMNLYNTVMKFERAGDFLKEISICNECGSPFIKSYMKGLCMECANILYSYPACEHIFSDGKCIKCGYDGSTSKYLEFLKNKGE